MSKFAYMAEGELNSQYLLDILKDYLDKLAISNNTNGIEEDDYKINPKSNRFVKWFKDTTKRLFKDKKSLDNYNKVLATRFIKEINDKLDIFLQTNVLSAKQIFDLNQTLKAINFEEVVPIIEEYRNKAIISSEKRFLKVLNDTKYLNYARSNYVLYNSPVTEIKPFLTDKVSDHRIDYVVIQKLIRHFVDLRYKELTTFDFEPSEVRFSVVSENFYNESITDGGLGDEIEDFIRSKILEKFTILKQEGVLKEDLDYKVNKIDTLLKKLKLNKIEKMIHELVKLKTEMAKVKEVMDKCKDTINSSTIFNKAHIFLVMDNLYYKLSKRCENLQQKIKQKLQSVDKDKTFSILYSIENDGKAQDIYDNLIDDETLSKADVKNTLNALRNEGKTMLTKSSNENKSHIASNLYDDYEINTEIHISEDDEGQAEDEIMIEDDE